MANERVTSKLCNTSEDPFIFSMVLNYIDRNVALWKAVLICSVNKPANVVWVHASNNTLLRSAKQSRQKWMNIICPSKYINCLQFYFYVSLDSPVHNSTYKQLHINVAVRHLSVSFVIVFIVYLKSFLLHIMYVYVPWMSGMNNFLSTFKKITFFYFDYYYYIIKRFEWIN